MARYDLGCGSKLKEGFEGIDFTPYHGVTHILNMDDPNIRLPFVDSSVDEFYASHFLEHIVNLIPLMNECWRCLKPNGKFEIIVPLAPSRGAFDDPTHVRFFGEATFKYFTEDAPGNQVIPSIKGRWNILKMDWTPKNSEDIHNVFENKMREIHVIMEPVKKEEAATSVAGSTFVENSTPALADN